MQDLYAVFIDLIKRFDTFNRIALWTVFRKLREPDLFISWECLVWCFLEERRLSPLRFPTRGVYLFLVCVLNHSVSDREDGVHTRFWRNGLLFDSVRKQSIEKLIHEAFFANDCPTSVQRICPPDRCKQVYWNKPHHVPPYYLLR